MRAASPTDRWWRSRRARQQMQTFKRAHKAAPKLTLTALGGGGWGNVSHVSSVRRGKVNTPAPHIVAGLGNTCHHARARQTNAVKSQQLKRGREGRLRAAIGLVNCTSIIEVRCFTITHHRIACTLATSGFMDCMIIYFYPVSPICPHVRVAVGGFVLDDARVSCRPSEVLMMSPPLQPGYGTEAVSRPG